MPRLSAAIRCGLLSSSAVAALALGPSPAAAQGAGSLQLLSTIVVSPTLLETDPHRVGSSVSVVTARDIDLAQRRTVVDVLATIPGLHVAQSGGPGGQAAIFMRGTNANHVKVLIDGIEMSDPSTPGRTFDFGHLLASDVERIEVLRGPQGGLYGSDAIGGVISITTKRGNGPPSIAATAEGGSFGTFNQSAAVGGGDDRFDWAFNAQHLHVGAVQAVPLDLIPPGRPVVPNAYDNWTFSGNVGARITDVLSARLIARHTNSAGEFVGDEFVGFSSIPAAAATEQLNRQTYIRGEAELSLLEGRFVNTFGASWSSHWQQVTEPPTIFGPSSPVLSIGERAKFDWTGVLAIAEGHKLLGGLEHLSERLDANATQASNTNAAGFVELQSAFDNGLGFVANLRHDVNGRFGGHTTWRVAPSFTIAATGTVLKASYGTGFKAPTLSQLFVDFPAFSFFANPNLKPETSTGYDFGFEQAVAGDRVRFGATYFHNDIANLINPDASFTTNINVGSATTYGIEAFADIRLTDTLGLRGDYTWTVALDNDTGLELLRRPTHKGSATLTWTPAGGLALSATALVVGPWIDGNRDFSIPRLTAPPYTVVNLAASYEVTEHAKLFARVDNLFDAHIEDPVGFLRPGRGIYAGVTLRN